SLESGVVSGARDRWFLGERGCLGSEGPSVPWRVRFPRERGTVGSLESGGASGARDRRFRRNLKTEFTKDRRFRRARGNAVYGSARIPVLHDHKRLAFTSLHITPGSAQ